MITSKQSLRGKLNNPTVVIEPKLQDKSVDITENGSQTIMADDKFDGLNQVNVNVNVSGGGDVSEYFDDVIMPRFFTNIRIK